MGTRISKRSCSAASRRVGRNHVEKLWALTRRSMCWRILSQAFTVATRLRRFPHQWKCCGKPYPVKGVLSSYPMIQPRDRISAPRGAVARLLRSTSSLHLFKCERGFCLNGSKGARENFVRLVQAIHSSFTAFPQRQASLISERKSLTSAVSLFIRKFFCTLRCACGEPNNAKQHRRRGGLAPSTVLKTPNHAATQRLNRCGGGESQSSCHWVGPVKLNNLLRVEIRL